MNKDVIYIEPEDDITDIITKIKASDSRVVALVPPKKVTVFRSAVNFKLLAKSARDTEKHVVLITADPSLVKLAASAKLPVARNLQTRPEIPKSPEDESGSSPDDTIIEGSAPSEKIPKTEEEAIESIDLSDDSIPKKSEKNGKPNSNSKAQEKAKGKEKKPSRIPSLDRYRKWIIIGSISAVCIAAFLVWALVFAPAAEITVAIRTNARNFSENISFTFDSAKEDLSNSLLYLEGHSITRQTTANFAATGTKDMGDRATGTVTLTRTNLSDNAIKIPKDTTFTYKELEFKSLEEVTLRAPTIEDCASFAGLVCTALKPNITATAKIQATSPGESSNLAAATSGWTSSVSGYTITSSALAGGTTKTIKIVSQEDVDKAKSTLSPASESVGRSELTGDFPSGLLPISSSFRADAKEPVVTPNVGDEVKEDDESPKITQETVFIMYGVDRVRVEEYIEQKTLANIQGESDRKIYSTGLSDEADKNKARIEQFSVGEDKMTAKLKSLVQIGPEITEEHIMEKALGKKIGEVQSQLKSVNGVASVSVDTSFFWVTSVPSDANKVTITIKIEE